MNPGSICSGWNGAQIANATLTVTITDNGANDVLTVTSTGCTVNFGSLALGADYVSATRDFGGSSFASFSRMQYDTATNALTVYLGAQKVAGGVNTNVPAGALTYTPSASMLSATGFAPSAGPFTFAADRF
jgi:hypothetical protein